MLFVHLQIIFLQFGSLSGSSIVPSSSAPSRPVIDRNPNQDNHQANDSIEVTNPIRKQLKENVGIPAPSILISPDNRDQAYDRRIEKSRSEENEILVPDRLNDSVNEQLNKELNQKLNQRLIGWRDGEEREAGRSQISEARPENGSVVNLTQETVKEFEKLIDEDDSVGDVNRARKLRLYARRWTRQLIGKTLSRWQFCEDLLELIEFDDGDLGTAGSRVEFLFNLHCYSHLKKPNLLIEFINKQQRATGLGAKRVGQLIRLTFDVALGNNSTTNLLSDVSYFNGVSHGANQMSGKNNESSSRGSTGEPDDDQQGSQENEDGRHKANFTGKSNLGSHLNLVILIDVHRRSGDRVSHEENRMDARDRQQLQRTFLATVKFMVHLHRLSLDKVTVLTRLDRIPNYERKFRFGGQAGAPFADRQCPC